MGTKQVTVGTAKISLVAREDTRSAILICNSHPSAIIYVTDDLDVSATSGFMVFPKTTLLLSYDEGVEVEKDFLVISDMDNTIVGVWEWFKRAKEEDVQEPEVMKDPLM